MDPTMNFNGKLRCIIRIPATKVLSLCKYPIKWFSSSRIWLLAASTAVISTKRTTDKTKATLYSSAGFH